MWKNIQRNIRYASILIPASLKAATQNKAAFWSLSIFMFIQNIMFFMVWVIYFSNFSSLRGWELADIATMYGLAAFSFGLAFLLCGGALDLGRSIVDGELDIYLGRPRHPLMGILFRESRVAGLGDIVTGPLLWIYFGNYTPIELGVLFMLGVFSGMIILSTALAINSLPFFVGQGNRVTDQLIESFICISTYPHNGFSMAVRIVLLTVIPAGFVAYLPIEAIRNFDISLMIIIAGAAAIYMIIAQAIFNTGLKNYTSGNKMLEVK